MNFDLKAFLSSACADALGASTEFKSPTTRLNRKGQHTHYQPGSPFGFLPGEATDDTQMCLSTLFGLKRHQQGEHLLHAVLDEHLKWIASHPPDVGGLTRQALSFKRLDGGYRAWQESNRTSAGNGGLMRANAPFIAGYRGDELVRITALTTALTHADPVCLMASVHLALTLMYAEQFNLAQIPKKKFLFKQALTYANDFLPGHIRDIHAALKQELDLPTHLQSNLKSLQAGAQAVIAAVQQVITGQFELRQTGYVLTTYQAAILHNLHHSNWLDIITPAVEFGDDSDTVACVAGMLAYAQGHHAPDYLVQDLKIGASWSGWQRPWAVLPHITHVLQ